MENQTQEQLPKRDKREAERAARLALEKRERTIALAKRLGLWLTVVVGLGTMVWGLAKLGTSAPTVSNETLSDPVTDADWIRGNKNTKVTLVEYSDLECPACAAAEPTVRQLARDFDGKIRLVYRHFPLMQHPHSQEAARAAEAAGKQGKFWEMHDKLFDNQTAWSHANNVKDVFAGYAKELGLDLTKFTADENSPDIQNKIGAYIASANRSNVNATPTFFLNGQKLNVQSFSDLIDAVKEAVNKSS